MPKFLTAKQLLEGNIPTKQPAHLGEVSWRQYVDRNRIVFEFNVKLRRLETSLDKDGFDFEVQDELMKFEVWLRKKYSWVESVYLGGRSGGWLTVVCKPGSGPTSTTVPHSIAKHIFSELQKFKKHVEKDYPR